MKTAIYWFRRDLRLNDNTALHEALKLNIPVVPIFIFDDNILEELPPNDARVSFIYQCLSNINKELAQYGSSVLCIKSTPLKAFEELTERYDIDSVFINKDYEPYATKRGNEIEQFLHSKGITLKRYKDQVIFEEDEVMKKDGKPYTVFTPYKNQWLKTLSDKPFKISKDNLYQNLLPEQSDFPELSNIGFTESPIKVRDYNLEHLDEYSAKRDFPYDDITSYLSVHLRFGTVSIREIISKLQPKHEGFLSELAWREFFMQILYHFPNVVSNNFKSKFDNVQWRNNEKEFELWCKGETGYPLVDAGMRELNTTGYMHNRVRMVAASFLCKHLLIDWRWGEAYFASKLLDYELSSNNGNWQWAASTGCDAVPYFRIFNPSEQIKRFDKEYRYIRKFIPEFQADSYIAPIVEHKFARERALNAYKSL